MKFQELVLKKVRCVDCWVGVHREIAHVDVCMQTVVGLLLHQMMLQITQAGLLLMVILVEILKIIIKHHKELDVHFCHLHHRKIVFAQHSQHSVHQHNLLVGCRIISIRHNFCNA